MLLTVLRWPSAGVEVGGRLGRARRREADRQAPGRVDPAAQDVGQRGGAFLAGEEPAHRGGQPVRPAATARRAGRPAGPGPPACRCPAARRAAPPGGRAAAGRRRRSPRRRCRAPNSPARSPSTATHTSASRAAARGGRDAGVVAAQDRAALRVADRVPGRVGAQRVQHGRHLDAHRHVRVVHADVRGERVAAEHGARPRRPAGRPPRSAGPAASGRTPVVAQQHDRPLGQLPGQRTGLARRPGPARLPSRSCGSGVPAGSSRPSSHFCAQHPGRPPGRPAPSSTVAGLEPRASSGSP